MSSATDSSRSITVERTVPAAPDEVWALVADVTRVGDWSPETTGAEWVGGAGGPAVGARFRGTNQNGSRKWRTTCRVTACEPGQRFAFDVAAGPFPVARWTYEFAPAGDGCLVTERWDDHRGALITRLAPFITGTKDRAERNRQTMTETLDRLASAAGKG